MGEGICGVFAHTPRDGSFEWHDLRDHLLSVATMAQCFGAKFGAASLCRALGLAHDLAKADPRFQDYLKACYQGLTAKSVPHAAPSAAAVYSSLGTLTIPIVGHHTGLQDKQSVRQRLEEADSASTQAAMSFGQQFEFPNRTEIEALSKSLNTPLASEFFLRMVFSCLVDADFLDTEAHFNPWLKHVRAWRAEFSALEAKLRANMNAMSDRTGMVNEVRREILMICREAAHLPQGAFRLTVPTGGGKTLSSLSFALGHAVQHDLDRVIVAIPYTSIIDQTAAVYEAIFGGGVVLEHHSAIEQEDDSEDMRFRNVRRRLASENWDAQIIVTTTVQLFESLLGNRTSKCRKLHNVARSVIVLDEVQTLPTGLLTTTLDVLQELITRYGVSVVFCTATQPDYSKLNVPLLANAAEIVPDPQQHFRELKRVTYRKHNRTVSHAELAAILAKYKQVLCVLNSRRDAVEVVRAIPKDLQPLHLSTLMCSHHRKRVLKEVKGRLKEKRPCILVSTQVVEAGVDVDFPVVYRVMGPLDRIVQVVGRCNREGKLERGECVVFELADGRQPTGSYCTGTGLARTLMRDRSESVDMPEAISEYFQDLYRHTVLDPKEIQVQRAALNFKTTAQKYRMIEDDTESLVVQEYDAETIRGLLERAVHEPGHEAIRRLVPYVVSIRQNECKRFHDQGLVHEHEAGVFVYTGPYDDLVGIGTGAEHDPADLVG